MIHLPTIKTVTIGPVTPKRCSSNAYVAAYRASDPAHKLGGLIPEVMGDFCTHVLDILTRRGRAAD
jgi:hypothetical protein